MARLTQKQTLMAIVGVTVLLCGAAGGGVYWASDLIEVERIEIQTKEKTIAAARKKIDKIPAIESKVIVLRENVANYVTILPQEAELSQFIRASEKFAVLSGISSIDRFVPVRGGAKGGAFRRMSYEYHFEATLWQFMKFMNFFESYDRFVRVRHFNLSSGSAKPGEDAVHSIRMTVETYLYNPDTKGAETRISNYDAKLVALRHEIVAAGSLEVSDPFEFRGREGRRDIFVDPRQSDLGDPSTPLVDQRRMIEEFSKLISELREKWEHSLSGQVSMFERIELQRAVSVGIREFEARAGHVTENKLIKNSSLTARWYKEVQVPYKSLVSKVRSDEAEGDRYLAKPEFVAVVASMVAKLEEGELESVMSHHSQVQSRIDVPKKHRLYKLRMRIEGLVMRAKVALEFGTIPLVISGVLVNEGGKSGVIINGEVYEEGDYISETLFVKKVRDDEVEFVYKGFTLIKTW